MQLCIVKIVLHTNLHAQMIQTVQMVWHVAKHHVIHQNVIHANVILLFLPYYALLIYNHFLKQNVLFKTYLNATRDFFVI
jgi:hypothetical protein